MWRPRPSPRRATSQPGHISWNVGMWSPMSREKTKDRQAPLECPEPYCSATCQPRDFRAGDTLSLEGHKGESLGGRGWLGPSQIGSEMAAEPGVQGQPAGCKRVPVAVPSQFCTPQPQRPADAWQARATHLAAGSWTLSALAHQLLLEEVAHAGDIHRSPREVSAERVCTLDRL